MIEYFDQVSGNEVVESLEESVDLGLDTLVKTIFEDEVAVLILVVVGHVDFFAAWFQFYIIVLAKEFG